MSAGEARVLLVDDEPDNRELYAAFLRGKAQVRTAASGDEALRQLEDEPADVLFVDKRMPEMDGIELATRVRVAYPETEIVMVTADPDLESAIDAVRMGFIDYLPKPVLRRTLQGALERSLERRRMLATLQRLQEEGGTGDGGVGRIVGESPGLRRLRASIARVQHRDVPVLIQGETGTGKELVARALHEGGHRQAGPFVPVNCAAVAPELLESELFGYEKGAFTGADRAKPGLVEAADGGTFFLDEVGELPLGLQAKLLRVLQEREVQRLGGTEPRPVDFRLVAATNRDLRAEVEGGRFREDLYYRLAVYPIQTVPLRECRDDLGRIAEHLLEEAARRHRIPAPTLGPEALGRLRTQDWPGNVRELGNICERILLVSEGPRVSEEEVALALEMGDAGRAGPPAGEAAPRGGLEAMLPEDGEFPTLRDLEAAYIERVLARCDGNRSQAARILGIHPTTLYRKLG